jgi:YbbR domain-containing protein
MSAIRNLFVRDAGLKIAALLIAFLVWSTFRAEPSVEIAYLAPLEFRNVPENLEISGDIPTQVRVRMRGRSAVLRRLTPADLAVTVDLTGSAAGESLIRLTGSEIDAPPGAEVVRVTPSEIRVRLVPRQAPNEAPQ